MLFSCRGRIKWTKAFAYFTHVQLLILLLLCICQFYGLLIWPKFWIKYTFLRNFRNDLRRYITFHISKSLLCSLPLNKNDEAIAACTVSVMLLYLVKCCEEVGNPGPRLLEMLMVCLPIWLIYLCNWNNLWGFSRSAVSSNQIFAWKFSDLFDLAYILPFGRHLPRATKCTQKRWKAAMILSKCHNVLCCLVHWCCITCRIATKTGVWGCSAVLCHI